MNRINRPARAVVMALAGLALSACSPQVDRSPFAEWIEKDPTTWKSPSSDTVHYRATLAAEAPADTAPLLPEEAGAEQYVKLAIQRNPSIRAAERKMEELTQRIAQVRSLDDPMVNIVPIGEMAETAAGQVGVMSSISQKLPSPGKLDARGRIAGQDVAMAAQDMEAVKLNVTADTRRAYWSYYFADRAIEVIQADRQLLEQFRDAASARYESGTAQQQDVLRASVEVSNLDNRLITLHQQRATAVAMLNRMLDRHVTAPLPAPRRVELSQLELQLDHLLADAARSNPSLQKVHERIEAYRQRLKLAKLNRLPDLTLSLTYNSVEDSGISRVANGKDQWWLGFGFNLPVWGEKLDAAEREARYGMMSGVAELTDQQNTIAFRVQDTMARVDTQQRLAILFRDVIVPQARQTVDASASAYRAGKMEFLTVVDNWRRLLDYELMYHQSLSQFEQALTELQQVVGRDVNRNAVESKDN